MTFLAACECTTSSSTLIPASAGAQPCASVSVPAVAGSERARGRARGRGRGRGRCGRTHGMGLVNEALERVRVAAARGGREE
eukprot:595043-Rhodomonas_salina.2